MFTIIRGWRLARVSTRGLGLGAPRLWPSLPVVVVARTDRRGAHDASADTEATHRPHTLGLKREIAIRVCTRMASYRIARNDPSAPGLAFGHVTERGGATT